MGSKSTKFQESIKKDQHFVSSTVTDKTKTHDTFDVDRKFTETHKGPEIHGRALNMRDSINDFGAEVCIGKDCK